MNAGSSFSYVKEIYTTIEKEIIKRADTLLKAVIDHPDNMCLASHLM